MDPAQPFRLRIPGAILDGVLTHARHELPNECVGFLAGTITGGVGVVSASFPLVNELASPTEFYTEPRSVLVAFRAMRGAGTDILAIYHSHPTSPPVPSRKDVERNTYGPDVVWLIVGLATDPPDVRAWWLGDSGYREAAWSVEG